MVSCASAFLHQDVCKNLHDPRVQPRRRWTRRQPERPFQLTPRGDADASPYFGLADEDFGLVVGRSKRQSAGSRDMTNDTSRADFSFGDDRHPEPDAQGQAALLLIESLIHSLLDNGALTKPQALEAIESAR